jgi:putative addiction module component (TIGR02574 family)
VTAAQKEELDRRWKDLQENPDEGESWDQVKNALLEE